MAYSFAILLFLKFWLFTYSVSEALTGNTFSQGALTIDAEPRPPRCSAEHLKDVKGWFIDLDGVIYDNSNVLPGAQAFMSRLTKMNQKFVPVSNGFSSPDYIKEKFARGSFQLDGVNMSQYGIFTAATAMADYLKGQKGKIFFSGTKSQKQNTLETLTTLLGDDASNFTIKEHLTDPEMYAWAEAAKKGESVFVVLAFGDGNPETSYNLLTVMSTLLYNGATLVTGGPDYSYPLPKNEENPSVTVVCPWSEAVAELIAGVGRTSEAPHSGKFQRRVGVGKGGNSAKHIMEPALRALHLENNEAHKAVMIGDNPLTDIAAANSIGASSILVLTGVTAMVSLKDIEPQNRPTCFVKDLTELTGVMSSVG